MSRMLIGPVILQKAYADGSVDVLSPQQKLVLRMTAPKEIQEPWGYPQTVSVLPGGAVLSTNQSLDVDNDGVGGSGGSHQNSLADGLSHNPLTERYLVESTTHLDNHGIRLHDFGVVLYNGQVIGMPYFDTGWALGGEASIKSLKDMGADPGPRYNRGLGAGRAQTLSFPNTAKYYRYGMTEDEVNAVTERLYNSYAAKYPNILRKMGWPAKYNGPTPASTTPVRHHQLRR